MEEDLIKKVTQYESKLKRYRTSLKKLLEESKNVCDRYGSDSGSSVPDILFGEIMAYQEAIQKLERRFPDVFKDKLEDKFPDLFD